jgi:DNA repair exonuclease SbcCD nuclease subunit
MRQGFSPALFLLLSVLLLILPFPEEGEGKGGAVTFVSFPDFFNFDIPDPWPKYDGAVRYFLDRVRDENPDFVLVAGDMVNGHWWDGPRCVEHMGAVYYSAWVRRMNRHGLRFFAAVGDHDLGDDPWPPEKLKLAPCFEEAFRTNLSMPANGPDGKKGLVYFVRKGGLLLVTVETFEAIGDSMHVTVTGGQLEWFKDVLNDNQDAAFKIVQGHVPIWGNVRSRSSSRLMLEGGRESAFYKAMAEGGVDLYLAGEFHDVTVLESDGIFEIVHGSSWGREIVDAEDYLVGRVEGNRMELSLKRIRFTASGEFMWNLNKDRGPRETVRINDETLSNGPETTGTLTIVREGGKKTYTGRKGYFKPE